MNDNLKNFNNLPIKTIIKRAIYPLKNKVVFTMATVFLLLISSVACFALEGNDSPNSSLTVYKVYNIDDLNKLRQLSENGESFENKTIILKNDINITSNGNFNGEAVNFKPIFGEGLEFKGTFDGQNNTLHCNVNNGEIIGNISKSGIVKNLKVTGCFEGDVDGAIFNYNEGTIENIAINAKIRDNFTSASAICCFNDGTINNCEVRGDIYTNDMNCAGISFTNSGKITQCKVFANLNNCVQPILIDDEENDKFQLPETAGITSFNSGLISGCVVKSKLFNKNGNEFYGSAGGLVSTNNGLIENSTFKGTVAASASGGISSSNYTIIKSCNINATIEGNNAAEFVACNIWGDIDFAWEKIKNEKQGVIDSCEFTGTVEAKRKGGLAAAANHINPRGDVPQIKNCKINGILIKRTPDYAIKSWTQKFD